MLKGYLLIIVLAISFSVNGQVTSVDFLMKYNCETGLYDVNLVVLDGSATTIPQRAQFNSQISFVIPTGETISIVEKNMPLQNNQQYDGTVPLNWKLSAGLISPEAQPENDFYSVTPTLSPAAFYNDITAGDEVLLFSLSIGNSNEYDDRVRFFNNDTDPDFSQWGLGDYSNGFTLRSPSQLYNSNSTVNCITDVQDLNTQNILSFPNPCRDYLTLTSEQEIIDILIIGIDGRTYYQSDLIYAKNLTISTDHFPKGLYYLTVDTNAGSVTHKIIKI